MVIQIQVSSTYTKLTAQGYIIDPFPDYTALDSGDFHNLLGSNEKLLDQVTWLRNYEHILPQPFLALTTVARASVALLWQLSTTTPYKASHSQRPQEKCHGED